MHFNNILNRIRISGIKVFVGALTFVLILTLALILRTFTVKTEPNAAAFVSGFNQALSLGDTQAMQEYFPDGSEFVERINEGLSPLEAELLRLNLREVRLRVGAAAQDRTEQQTNLSLWVESPDLSLLGTAWLEAGDTREDLLAHYSSAVADLPQAEPIRLDLILVSGDEQSGGKVLSADNADPAEVLTRRFRSELSELRVLLNETGHASTVKLSGGEGAENTVKPEAAGPVLQGKKAKNRTAGSDAGSAATSEGTAREDDSDSDVSAEMKVTEQEPLRSGSTSTAEKEAPVTRDAPVNTETPFYTDAPVNTEAPAYTETPTPAAPQVPVIGRYYTVTSMQEDLLQIALQAYSGYANPEDYVYLIIEANGLQVTNGQVILYYGQSIYLPMPPQ